MHVEQLRGGHVETTHPISAIVVDARGICWSAGSDVGTFWRSSSKPLQLLTSLECLPDEMVATLGDWELALGAASHGATPGHVAAVQALLARFGLRAEDLRCGAHWPSDEASAHALAAGGGTPSVLHNNCSGKHTFMLAATVAQRWPRDYRPVDHPLQARNLARITEWGGARPGIGVDGCGVPTFHVPLSAMARTFARLGTEMRGRSLAGRIGRAMAAEPEMTSAPGEIDVTLVRSARSPVVAKRGAEGLICLAIPDRELGIAVKCHTGSTQALGVGLRAVLDEVAPDLAPDWRWGHELRNVVGALVGERRAVR